METATHHIAHGKKVSVDFNQAGKMHGHIIDSFVENGRMTYAVEVVTNTTDQTTAVIKVDYEWVKEVPEDGL